MAYLARSPLKVILFGEHGVLSGARCLAISIKIYGYLAMKPSPRDKAVVIDGEGNYIDLIEKYKCSIPGSDAILFLEASLGCGLGTSAAVSLLLSYGRVQDSKMTREALAIENMFHGKASGVDVLACYTGGLISFKQGNVQKLSTRHLSRFKILIFNSRIPKNTQSAIQVGELKKELYDEIGKISEEAYWLLQREFTLEELYKLIRKSQDLLDELGVCPREMREVVRRMRDIGVEVKITGAGCGGHLVTVVNKDLEIPGWTPVSIDLQGFYIFDTEC
ncbi:mevalonate kinase [Encephalitozoon intestinalis ATCC 50506]|uniref:Mevalonate kinase n=1 Tax=Encephalitozoon intestinalis (strain ATCC 50506) TaxID=876142 RepID=E0S965_ENCIT|nr:mevalonate kinase [Encephalitozoon intestinalis ATCC 50506]ADM12308.1 mevalonate kinase [Encephalitozoon intestinalis ATCC 50506]UTX46120.1 mevalonate kinase [Encephalitozoon intestinalis]